MLTFIDVKFIFDCACLYSVVYVFRQVLEDKGFFSSANILQIADVIRQVVFLLLLLCFQPIVHLFIPRETSEMFHHHFA